MSAEKKVQIKLGKVQERRDADVGEIENSEEAFCKELEFKEKEE